MKIVIVYYIINISDTLDNGIINIMRKGVFKMTTRKTLRSLMTMVIMVMAFAVTGITAKAETVTNLKQTEAVKNRIRIDWVGVNGAKGYEVQVASDKEFTQMIPALTKTTSTPYISISDIAQGGTFYIRVGYRMDYKDEFANYSEPCEVVTVPTEIELIKFVGADDKTAHLEWTEAYGATGYDVEHRGEHTLVAGLSCKLPINDGSYESASIKPYRESSSGFKAIGSATNISNLSKLTTKISTKNFGITQALTSINVHRFGALGSGDGWEIQGQTVSGKKYTFSGNVTSISKTSASIIRIANAIKYSKMYKYRVRAYVVTTDSNRIQGKKYYGNWSDYRYVTFPKSVKYSTANNQIKLSWSKLTGVSKVKIQISTKENSGYKTCDTISGKKTTYTIKKYGKAKLKKGKSYWVRISYQYKSGKKTYTSDYMNQDKIKVR